MFENEEDKKKRLAGRLGSEPTPNFGASPIKVKEGGPRNRNFDKNDPRRARAKDTLE